MLKIELEQKIAEMETEKNIAKLTMLDCIEESLKMAISIFDDDKVNNKYAVSQYWSREAVGLSSAYYFLTKHRANEIEKIKALEDKLQELEIAFLTK